MNKFNLSDNSMNIVGKNIKKIRKDKKNVTQEDLCARMQVMGFKLSRSDISKLENGKRFINDIEIVGFADALKVSILDLYKKIKNAPLVVGFIFSTVPKWTFFILY